MNSKTIILLIIAFNSCFAWEQVDNFVRNVESAKSECTEKDKYGVPDSWFSTSKTYLDDLWDKSLKPILKLTDKHLMESCCKSMYVKICKKTEQLWTRLNNLYQDKIGKLMEDDVNDYPETFRNFVTFGACSLNTIYGGMGYLVFATVDFYLFVTVMYTLLQILMSPYYLVVKIIHCCCGKGCKNDAKVAKPKNKTPKSKPKSE